MSDDLSGIFDGGSELIATGFGFTEGPLWHPDGFLYFVDLRVSKLFQWTPDKGVEVVRENTNEGNGITFDLHGRVVMCDAGDRRIARDEPDGTRTVVADRWGGDKRFNKPNDIVGRSDGTLYFTDPAYNDPYWDVPRDELDLKFGAVFSIAPDGPDGSHGKVLLVADNIPFPNGLALSPDESVMYVANSFDDRFIQAYDVQPGGSLTNSRLFGDMNSDEPGVPDGLKVDEAGRVFCGGSGGTWVFDKEGQHLGTFITPEVCANLTFGGPDRRTLYITAWTSVYRVRVKVPGTKIPSLAF